MEIFFIFFIPYSIYCLLGGIALTAAMGIGESSQSLSRWIVENYAIIIGIIVALAIIVACIYAKRVSIMSAVAGLFAVSSPLYLFGGVMYELLRVSAKESFGNAWAMWLFVLPVLIVYLIIHGFVLKLGFTKNAETGKSWILWLLGVAGWIVLFLF